MASVNCAFGKSPASVFIYAGQSNADGRAPIESLPPYILDGYDHLRIASMTKPCDGTFGDMAFGKQFAFCDVTNYLIDRVSKQDFYAVKCTKGGTSITPGSAKPNLPVWYADDAWIAAQKPFRGLFKEGESLTLALTEGFKMCVDSTLSRLPHGYDVKAIMWHQGESDRKLSGDYYSNFKKMITFMRMQIAKSTGNEKDMTLPFIFGTVPHASKQYSAEVEAAQRRVAKELPNVHIIDLSDAGVMADSLHFDGPWTECVGKMMFNKLVELNLVKGNAAKVSKPVK